MPTVSFTTSGALQKSALRQANERLVLNAIRRTPGISRSEIARHTGFSRTSVTFVVNRLLGRSLVREKKIANGTSAGRTPTALHIRAGAMTAIGVEIIRTGSNVVLVDVNGEILAEQTVAWHADPELYLDAIHLAIRNVARSRKPQQVLGVGVALPGTMDKAAGFVVAAEALGWFGVDAGTLLRSRLDWPVFFENNANLSALAEQWYSPSQGKALRYFVYIRLQDGLGSGVVVDGRIIQGVAAPGAEFGHMMLYPDGRPCHCGNHGCWEQYASDGALVRAYRELAGKAPGDGGNIFEEALRIVGMAKAGDAHALGAVKTTAFYLGLGFVNVLAAVNPEAIIVGEPMASAWDLVEGIVRDELCRRVPQYYVKDLRLLPSFRDTHSALRGAAALALGHFFTRFDHTGDDPMPMGVTIEAHP